MPPGGENLAGAAVDEGGGSTETGGGQGGNETAFFGRDPSANVGDGEMLPCQQQDKREGGACQDEKDKKVEAHISYVLSPPVHHAFVDWLANSPESHYRCDVEGQHRALKLVEGVVKRHMGLGYSRRLGMEMMQLSMKEYRGDMMIGLAGRIRKRSTDTGDFRAFLRFLKLDDVFSDQADDGETRPRRRRNLESPSPSLPPFSPSSSSSPTLDGAQGGYPIRSALFPTGRMKEGGKVGGTEGRAPLGKQGKGEKKQKEWEKGAGAGDFSAAQREVAEQMASPSRGEDPVRAEYGKALKVGEKDMDKKRKEMEQREISAAKLLLTVMTADLVAEFTEWLVRERPMLTPVTIRSYIRQPGVIIRKLAAVFGDQKYTPRGKEEFRAYVIRNHKALYYASKMGTFMDKAAWKYFALFLEIPLAQNLWAQNDSVLLSSLKEKEESKSTPSAPADTTEGDVEMSHQNPGEKDQGEASVHPAVAVLPNQELALQAMEAKIIMGGERRKDEKHQEGVGTNCREAAGVKGTERKEANEREEYRKEREAMKVREEGNEEGLEKGKCNAVADGALDLVWKKGKKGAFHIDLDEAEDETEEEENDGNVTTNHIRDSCRDCSENERLSRETQSTDKDKGLHEDTSATEREEYNPSAFEMIRNSSHGDKEGGIGKIADEGRREARLDTGGDGGVGGGEVRIEGDVSAYRWNVGATIRGGDMELELRTGAAADAGLENNLDDPGSEWVSSDGGQKTRDPRRERGFDVARGNTCYGEESGQGGIVRGTGGSMDSFAAEKKPEKEEGTLEPKMADGKGERVGGDAVIGGVLSIIVKKYFRLFLRQSGLVRYKWYRYTQMCDGLLTATMRSTRSGNSWQPESLQTKEELFLWLKHHLPQFMAKIPQQGPRREAARLLLLFLGISSPDAAPLLDDARIGNELGTLSSVDSTTPASGKPSRGPSWDLLTKATAEVSANNFHLQNPGVARASSSVPFLSPPSPSFASADPPLPGPPLAPPLSTTPPLTFDSRESTAVGGNSVIPQFLLLQFEHHLWHFCGMPSIKARDFARAVDEAVACWYQRRRNSQPGDTSLPALSLRQLFESVREHWQEIALGVVTIRSKKACDSFMEFLGTGTYGEAGRKAASPYLQRRNASARRDKSVSSIGEDWEGQSSRLTGSTRKANAAPLSPSSAAVLPSTSSTSVLPSTSSGHSLSHASLLLSASALSLPSLHAPPAALSASHVPSLSLTSIRPPAETSLPMGGPAYNLFSQRRTDQDGEAGGRAELNGNSTENARISVGSRQEEGGRGSREENRSGAEGCRERERLRRYGQEERGEGVGGCDGKCFENVRREVERPQWLSQDDEAEVREEAPGTALSRASLSEVIHFNEEMEHRFISGSNPRQGENLAGEKRKTVMEMRHALGEGQAKVVRIENLGESEDTPQSWCPPRLNEGHQMDDEKEEENTGEEDMKDKGRGEGSAKPVAEETSSGVTLGASEKGIEIERQEGANDRQRETQEEKEDDVADGIKIAFPLKILDEAVAKSFLTAASEEFGGEIAARQLQKVDRVLAVTRQELGKASRVLGHTRLKNFIRKYDGLFRDMASDLDSAFWKRSEEGVDQRGEQYQPRGEARETSIANNDDDGLKGGERERNAKRVAAGGKSEVEGPGEWLSAYHLFSSHLLRNVGEAKMKEGMTKLFPAASSDIAKSEDENANCLSNPDIDVRRSLPASPSFLFQREGSLVRALLKRGSDVLPAVLLQGPPNEDEEEEEEDGVEEDREDEEVGECCKEEYEEEEEEEDEEEESQLARAFLYASLSPSESRSRSSLFYKLNEMGKERDASRNSGCAEKGKEAVKASSPILTRDLARDLRDFLKGDERQQALLEEAMEDLRTRVQESGSFSSSCELGSFLRRHARLVAARPANAEAAWQKLFDFVGLESIPLQGRRTPPLSSDSTSSSSSVCSSLSSSSNSGESFQVWLFKTGHTTSYVKAGKNVRLLERVIRRAMRLLGIRERLPDGLGSRMTLRNIIQRPRRQKRLEGGVAKMRKPTLEVLEDDVRAMRSAELTLYWQHFKDYLGLNPASAISNSRRGRRSSLVRSSSSPNLSILSSEATWYEKAVGGFIGLKIEHRAQLKSRIERGGVTSGTAGNYLRMLCSLLSRHLKRTVDGGRGANIQAELCFVSWTAVSAFLEKYKEAIRQSLRVEHRGARLGLEHLIAFIQARNMHSSASEPPSPLFSSPPLRPASTIPAFSNGMAEALRDYICSSRGVSRLTSRSCVAYVSTLLGQVAGDKRTPGRSKTLFENWTDVVSFLRKHDKLLSSALAKEQQHTNIQLGFDALRGYLEERGISFCRGVIRQGCKREAVEEGEDGLQEEEINEEEKNDQNGHDGTAFLSRFRHKRRRMRRSSRSSMHPGMFTQKMCDSFASWVCKNEQRAPKMAASYAVMMTSLFQTVKEQVEKENNETAKNLQLSSWKAVRSFMAAHGVNFTATLSRRNGSVQCAYRMLQKFLDTDSPDHL